MRCPCARRPGGCILTGKGMQTVESAESRAIRNLIAEIDAIDRWRDSTGRIIVGLFAGVFVIALVLLFYTVTYAHPPQIREYPGPKVPGVLKSWSPRTAVSPSPSSLPQ